MKTKELIKALEEQTNFIVLPLEGEPLLFCYRQGRNPRSEILATLPQEALSMQEFKEKNIDWNHYEGSKPKQREVIKFYELLNKYTETPIIDRIDDSYFWQEYLRQLDKKRNNEVSNGVNEFLKESREVNYK